MSSMITRQAIASDLIAAQSWLADAGLPVEDLTPDHMQNFLVTLADESPVGMIGIEKFGDVGLLRSPVVRCNSARWPYYYRSRFQRTSSPFSTRARTRAITNSRSDRRFRYFRTSGRTDSTPARVVVMRSARRTVVRAR